MLSLFFLLHSKQGSGTDFLFHGYQQVVILNLICCTVTAHYSFLYCRFPSKCPTPSMRRWLVGHLFPLVNRGGGSRRYRPRSQCGVLYEGSLLAQRGQMHNAKCSVALEPHVCLVTEVHLSKKRHFGSLNSS